MTSGVKVTNLTNVTSIPASINVIGTQRIGGVEKAVKIQGVNLIQITSVNNALSARISTVSSLAVAGNTSALSLRITSVNSRIANVSGEATSVNSKLTTTSARITSVNENVTSALAKIATVSALFRSSVFFLSGASINITSTHKNKTVRLNHNAAMRARLNATGWSKDDSVTLIQWGAGQVSVGSANTLRSRGSKFQSAGQYGVIAVILVSAGEFVVTGDVSV